MDEGLGLKRVNKWIRYHSLMGASELFSVQFNPVDKWLNQSYPDPRECSIR